MTEAERTEITGRNLVLFDGICVLCNRTVRFLLRRDIHDRLRFAPADSPLGREFLSRFNVPAQPNGVTLITAALTPSERLYTRSDASAQALQLLGSPWRTLGRLLAATPRLLREPAYSLVARTRYRLWGRLTSCPIPKPNERPHILGL